jgi:hypothetical protein
MDKKEFDERVLRLQDVAKVIDKLPAEIRTEAFGLLRGYVSGRSAPDSGGVNRTENEDGDDADDGTSLFGRFDHDKPSDNVRLIAAYLFQQYGSEHFSVEEISAIAAETGITVPARVDMTLRQAKENGKNLFVGAGNGKYKPTVHGETYLKDTYGVKKGNKKREEVAQ